MDQQHEAPEYFGLTNDIIFGWIMKNDELCLAIIRAILPDLNITGIAHKEPQHEVSHVTSARGVRFDVVVEDDQQRFYDVEMQVENNGDLGKRTRYYQSQIDNETLLKHQSFRQLKESHVIFLCAFDPFGYGLRRYQFHQYEDHHKELRLDTQAHVIFINAKGTQGEVTNDLAGVIDVMNQEPNQANSLATKLVREIDYYNQDPKRRRELMDYATKLEDERRLGEREANKQNARNMIIELKANKADQNFIFQFVKNVVKGKLSDEEINKLIKETENN